LEFDLTDFLPEIAIDRGERGINIANEKVNIDIREEE
jgi:hypothetical protein